MEFFVGAPAGRGGAKVADGYGRGRGSWSLGACILHRGRQAATEDRETHRRPRGESSLGLGTSARRGLPAGPRLLPDAGADGSCWIFQGVDWNLGRCFLLVGEQ